MTDATAAGSTAIVVIQANPGKPVGMTAVTQPSGAVITTDASGPDDYTPPPV
jgi:hypothetical protein